MQRLQSIVDRLLAGFLRVGAWLALPIALILFLQWPLRDLVHGYSRQANDVGQWLFALYVAMAATAATRARRHIASDAVASRYRPETRRRIYVIGLLVAVLPWSLFVIVGAWPTTVQSVAGLERFPDTFDPLYFVIKIAVILLPALLLLQAVLDLFGGSAARGTLSWMGFVLVLAAIAGITLTGLPAFIVLMAVSAVGATIGVASGAIPLPLLSAVPLRLSALMENDLLQALPLYVLMGSLLNRLPVVDSLFRTMVGILPRRASAPLASGMMLGAMLGPMNGAVGASVVALSGTLAPRLDRYGVPPTERTAAVVVASTLGIVVPPSLVLILLGDAMLAANTLAINATGRSGRAINTQDVFLAALPAAALFLALCIAVSALVGRRTPLSALAPTEPLRAREVAISVAAVAFVVALLAGVTLGYFYAVEAAAMGAVALFALGLATRSIDRIALAAVLKESMITSGALFMLVVAANTLTLVFRSFGSDKVLEQWIAAIPGGELAATAVVLALIGATAFALDAFEIIFFVIPIVIPPLLIRVPDAAWVSVLVLLALQASFMLPPVGYALILARGILRDRSPLLRLMRALAPYLAAQLAVLALVLFVPAIVHVGRPNLTVAAPLPAMSDDEIRQRFLENAAPASAPSEQGPRF